jgi:PIN domain nuclease of toxin-antitoxin system
MIPPVLLDTCAAIWFANKQLSKSALEAIDRTHKDGGVLYVSPITAWELGLLVSRGRINLLMPAARWFEKLMQAPGLKLAQMPPDVLISSSFLPGEPPRDPADRIIAATAREYGYVLMTRDRPLLEYAREGHLQAIGC